MLCKDFLSQNLSRWGAHEVIDGNGATFWLRTFDRFMPRRWLPSSGFRAIILAAHLCEEVTAFGFEEQTASKKATGFHFWETTATRADGDRARHDMLQEHKLLSFLSKLDHVPVCV